MTHLDAAAQAIGYAAMVLCGMWCAGKMLAATAWALFENIKRNGRLVEYVLWRSKQSTEVKP